MNRETAKEILAAFRPGTDDEGDPVFAEALALARSDAELKAWFKDAQSFDHLMKAELARIAAPADVRERILASPKIIQPAPWWNARLNGRHWAAAAAVVVIGAGLFFWFASTRPATFHEFRREIADQSWGSAPHVEHKAGDIVEVRRALEAQGLPSRFHVPPALEPAVRGYSLMHWRGRELPMICFHSEGQHLHMLVVDRHLFHDAPSSGPQMDQWAVWRTASWSRDEFSYVLTGLNTTTFVKKFRKSKRWDWEG